jgi:hypothetical protein
VLAIGGVQGYPHRLDPFFSIVGRVHGDGRERHRPLFSARPTGDKKKKKKAAAAAEIERQEGVIRLERRAKYPRPSGRRFGATRFAVIGKRRYHVSALANV